jgi:hypothetical protein
MKEENEERIEKRREIRMILLPAVVRTDLSSFTNQRYHPTRGSLDCQHFLW